MQKLSNHALKLAAWSPHKVMDALNCPYMFNKKRTKSEVKVFVDDSDARVGSALHSYLESLIENPELVKNANVLYSIFDSNALTHKELVKFQLLAPVAEKSVKRINTYMEKHGVNRAEDLHVELAVAFDKDFNIVPFLSQETFFRGRIDLAMKLSDNTAVVLDHKSGSLNDISDSYKFQLLSYLVLFFFKKLKDLPDPISRYVYYFNILGGDNPDIVKGEEFGSFEEVFNKFVDTINGAAEQAATNEAKLGKHCTWCPYKDVCPLNAK
jgi:RecB family exonuclease